MTGAHQFWAAPDDRINPVPPAAGYNTGLLRRWLALHLRALIRALLKDEGWLFPWRSRWAVYRWLKPIRRSLGIAFTPHMARHSLGRWLNEAGASLRTIMDTLGHADIHSSARYQSTDIEVIRATSARIGALRASSPAHSQAKSKHARRSDARA